MILVFIALNTTHNDAYIYKTGKGLKTVIDSDKNPTKIIIIKGNIKFESALKLRYQLQDARWSRYDAELAPQWSIGESIIIEIYHKNGKDILKRKIE